MLNLLFTFRLGLAVSASSRSDYSLSSSRMESLESVAALFLLPVWLVMMVWMGLLPMRNSSAPKMAPSLR